MTRPLTKPDARGEDLGPGARRSWRQRFDYWLPLIAALFLAVLAVMSVVSVAAFSGLKKANQSLERQRLTAVNGCERVQLVRDDVNVVAWGVTNALKGVDMKPSSKLPELFAKVDPATAKLLQALIAGDADSRARLLRIRDEQRYLGPTDCHVASLDPAYRFPRPVPFADVASCYDPDRNPRPVGCPR